MHDQVKEYYGKVLQKSNDLKTNACCTGSEMPEYVKSVLSEIHDEVMTRYYGCGLVIPQSLEGMRVLDLGCGSGRDCYALSYLVGESGEVIGVDMTDEQLEVANKYIDYHTEKYGYQKPNVSFRKGYIERLEELGFEDNSVDIFISNCVINLSPDKEAVLREVYRILKPGGELYFSDVYSDRRVPGQLVEDPILYGECLSGALYWNDFLRLAKKCGFLDPRLVEDSQITIENSKIQKLLGNINFYSATYRLFKIASLESQCEDYGQAVIYKGTIPHHFDMFALDKHHQIEKGRVFPVCGNTYRMLNETRFAHHFEFIGNWDIHYGIYDDCGTSIPFDSDNCCKNEGGSCC